MSRRRTSKSLAEEIAEQFADVPLKFGVATSVVLAATGWALPIVFPLSTPIGLSMVGAWVQIFRWILWGFAAFILISSLGGAARRLFDRRRFDSDVPLEDMSWEQFEGYLAEYFRRRGETVTYRGGTSSDGGVDLVLDGPSGRRIVQAKHWKTRSVGVVPLRALWGVLGDEGADGAVIVTSGDFTADAREFARGKQFELIDGVLLRRLVAEVKGVAPAAQPVPVIAGANTCPQCGVGTLERRLARRGRNAGSYFFGCSRFPECRFTREL